MYIAEGLAGTLEGVDLAAMLARRQAWASCGARSIIVLLAAIEPSAQTGASSLLRWIRRPTPL